MYTQDGVSRREQMEQIADIITNIDPSSNVKIVAVASLVTDEHSPH